MQVSSLSESVKEMGGQLREELAVGSALRRQVVEWSSTLGAQRTLLEAPEHNNDLAAVMVLVEGLLEGQVGEEVPARQLAQLSAAFRVRAPCCRPDVRCLGAVFGQPNELSLGWCIPPIMHLRQWSCIPCPPLQVNPYGERYTLQMVLAGNVDMLRAVFLHYSQVSVLVHALAWPSFESKLPGFEMASVLMPAAARMCSKQLMPDPPISQIGPINVKR
jgi:hypothetical protein